MGDDVVANPGFGDRNQVDLDFPAVDLYGLSAPFAAINVGLESFHDALAAQDAAAVHVDWRPPAGGDEKLMAILRKMRPKETDTP